MSQIDIRQLFSIKNILIFENLYKFEYIWGSFRAFILPYAVVLNNPMWSTLSQGMEILARDGPASFVKRSSRFAISKFYLSRLGDPIAFWISRREIRNRMDAENGLEDILDTILDIKPGVGAYQLSAAQLREELRQLAKLVDSENPENVLEIGTANGGTFYTWCRYLETPSTVISLDLPSGRFGGGYVNKKTSIFGDFSINKELKFVRGDSHNEQTHEKIDWLLGSDKVDFLFIDGDHTYHGVKRDFEMYKPLVNDGGIIAFHDIVDHPDQKEVVNQRRKSAEVEERHLNWAPNFKDCNVNEFWEEIKEDYESTEIVSNPSQTWGGIGVIKL